MSSENSRTPELTDEEMDQGVIDQMMCQYKLSEGLSPEERDAGLALAKRLMISRRRRYDKIHERQHVLQEIRSSVWLLRNYHRGGHEGFREMLDSLESGIEMDFDSMSKGYIER